MTTRTYMYMYIQYTNLIVMQEKKSGVLAFG